MYVKVKNLDQFQSKALMALFKWEQFVISKKLSWMFETHSRLSQERKFIFFRRHKNLPEPKIENWEVYVERYIHEVPNDIVKALKNMREISNLIRMAEKSSKLKDFDFFVSKAEMALVEKIPLQNSPNKVE